MTNSKAVKYIFIFFRSCNNNQLLFNSFIIVDVIVKFCELHLPLKSSVSIVQITAPPKCFFFKKSNLVLILFGSSKLINWSSFHIYGTLYSESLTICHLSDSFCCNSQIYSRKSFYKYFQNFHSFNLIIA